MKVRRIRFLPVALVIAVAAPLSAQIESGRISLALDHERDGRFEEAAQEYDRILADNPVSLPALLGIERVYAALGRPQDVMPYLDAALEEQPRHRQIRAATIRVWGTMGDPERLEFWARRWIDADPTSREPYREWAFALAQSGSPERAAAVLEEGLVRFPGSDLAVELARVEVMRNAWADARQRWLEVVLQNPAQVWNGVSSLGIAPVTEREVVLEPLLRRPPQDPGRLLAAGLLVTWDRPLEGWTVLDRALPDNVSESVGFLRHFADRAEMLRSPEGSRARGFAFERMASISVGPAAQRSLIEAARAFAEAGDRAAASRVLGLLAEAETPAARQGEAVASLIEVMAATGRAEDAQEQLSRWESNLPLERVAELRRKVAWAWVAQGELERASRILATDSSVAAAAVQGWISAYRGYLSGAKTWFRMAGPFAGSRREATQRSELIALIQRINLDSLPQLGAALLDLRTGDTAQAIAKLEDTLEKVRSPGGRADLMRFTGAILEATGRIPEAQEHFSSAITADPEGPAAPAAQFALARSHYRLGRNEAAMALLEELILTYPESATVPQARRLLNRIKGSIPRS